MAPNPAADKLIVALDFPAAEPALALVDRLGEAVAWYKIGLELYSAEGGDIVRRVRDRGKRVFLDLKFHDIPNTVAGAARVVSKLGTDIFNVHAQGGRAMLRAAKDAAAEGAAQAGLPPPQVYGVTMLTSIDDAVLRDELGYTFTAAEAVVRFAELTKAAGLEGVVASPHEVSAIRARCGADFGVLTPGVRPRGSAEHDQRRLATPGAAVRNGADYIVVGRAITQAADPARAACEVLDEIAEAL